MLGSACLLSVLHGENADKTYAYVAGVMSVPEGTVVPNAVNPVVLYDIDDGKDAVYAGLPDWIKNLHPAEQGVQGGRTAGRDPGRRVGPSIGSEYGASPQSGRQGNASGRDVFPLHPSST